MQRDDQLAHRDSQLPLPIQGDDQLVQGDDLQVCHLDRGEEFEAQKKGKDQVHPEGHGVHREGHGVRGEDVQVHRKDDGHRMTDDKEDQHAQEESQKLRCDGRLPEEDQLIADEDQLIAEEDFVTEDRPVDKSDQISLPDSFRTCR